MKRYWREFKEFAVKGSVVDLAVAVIIGAAFGKIVTSLVADVIMPPLGLLLGGLNFSDIKIVLHKAVGSAPAVTLNIGSFIQNVIDFLIIALVIFVMIKMISRLKRQLKSEPDKPVEAPTVPTKDQELLTEIRDLLKK